MCADEPVFERTFAARHGTPVPVGRHVLRVTAPNASPYTFEGTNSYIIGLETVAVLDPGPQDEDHLAALLAAIDGRRVSHILVTHTHRDHSPLARTLARLTGAPTVGEGPHRFLSQSGMGDNGLDASADLDFAPDIAVVDGEVLTCGGVALRAIATPGHAVNHMAFELADERLLFSGDHVMAWATTIIAPPDGSMNDYLASLDKVGALDCETFLPGHGGPVQSPQRFTRALRSHRLMREAAIFERVRLGDRTIKTIVENVYHAVDPRLHGAAALTTLAHLERLVQNGAVKADGAPGASCRFEPA